MKILSRHAVTLLITTALALVAVLAFAGEVLAGEQPFVMSGKEQIAKDDTNASEAQTTMKVRVTAKGKTTVFELNNSQAAKDLYAQLPLNIEVEDYSDNEKIFYPPKKLNTSDAPQADARAGTLAYYAPWGDVVMFYENFGSASGLYELGHAVSGSEHINGMNGTIQVEKASSP